MSSLALSYPVKLGFLPASQAIADPEHPGLFRAGARAAAPYGDNRVEIHICSAVDLSQHSEIKPDLYEFGFDQVDLSGLEVLQQGCSQVEKSGQITSREILAIRAALEGATLRCASGKSLTVLHLAEEGFILRRSGPNRLEVVEPGSSSADSHGGATSVHADQDVFGTPLAQLMESRAPELFRHDSPDGSNHEASLMLLNVWIPLRQITQPLVLADGRSIKRRQHQLRYGLATDSFLNRDEDLVINDIWSFLYDADQHWYFRSEMDSRTAYVFNTLSTPHGCGVLPGEVLAEELFLTLQLAEDAVVRGQAQELISAIGHQQQLPESSSDISEQSVTPALSDAIEAMRSVLEVARAQPEIVCSSGAEQWIDDSRAARKLVVRMSIELRMVASVSSES